MCVEFRPVLRCLVEEYQGTREIRRRESTQDHPVEVLFAGEHEVQGKEDHVYRGILLDQESQKGKDIHGQVLLPLKEVEHPQEQRQEEAVLVEVVEAAHGGGRIQGVDQSHHDLRALGQLEVARQQYRRDHAACHQHGLADLQGQRRREDGVKGQEQVVYGGLYYLEEVDAPTGYHKLTARTKFTIADSNLDSIQLDGKYSGGGVHVVNKSGSILPQTGGMGTMLFITFGTMVVLGTGVLLVTKKRMDMIVE